MISENPFFIAVLLQSYCCVIAVLLRQKNWRARNLIERGRADLREI